MKQHYLFSLMVLITIGLSVEAQTTYTVDTFVDGADVNLADGTCDAGGGVCTFRAALQEAAATAGAVEVILPDGNYAWTDGELVLNAGDITVLGGGARTTIVDAAGSSRFFDLGSGLALLNLNDLEFLNGFDGNDPGGAIENDCENFILNRVSIKDCTSGIGFGGGVHNRGSMELYGCVFSGCVAEANNGQNGGGGGGGAFGGGGAVSSWLGSSSVFENCTFSGCQALGGNGGNGGAGGGGGDGGNSFTNWGGGGDGGNIGGGEENGGAGSVGAGGGGGGFSNGGWGNPGGPGDGGSGTMFGGSGGDGATNGGGGGGGAAAFGGAFFARSGTHFFRHCTFSENAAIPGIAGNSWGSGAAPSDGVARGGAIGSTGGDITLDNCLIWGNAAFGAPTGDDEDVYLNGGGPLMSVVGHNLVGKLGDNPDSEFTAFSVGNLIGIVPELLPFGDYGGPTDAYMLSACEPVSPAIDAAANLGVVEDQRGVIRDANPDIGAIEGPVAVDLDPIVEVVCPMETVELSLSWPDATTTWPDGSVGDTWTTGSVMGAVATITTAEGCEEEIDLDVSEVVIDTPDLGPDQTVCPNTILTFDAGNPGALYTWTLNGNPSGFAQAELVGLEGTVAVTVEVMGCQTSGTVEVVWLENYPLDLGPAVTLCVGEDVTLDAANSAWGGLSPSFQWQGGPSDAEFTVNATGTYSVTATTVEGCDVTDDIDVTLSTLTGVDLGNDATVCPGEPFILDPGYPAATCLWQDGTVSATYAVTNTGIYSVNVSDGECQVNDQVFIEVVDTFDANLPQYLSFCEQDSVLVLAAFGAANYIWSNGVQGNQLWVSSPGTYEVTSSQSGCDFVDIVLVTAQPLPPVDLGLDLVLCEGESVDLNPGVSGADYVIFNDSLTTPVLAVNESGEYTVTVALNGCINQDTIEVEVRPIPEFDLAEDSVLCPGEVFSIETGLSDVLVTWNTGEVGPSIEVNQPMTYVATSQVSGCEFVDSIVVDVAQPIAVPLEVEYTLCLEDSITLNALQGEAVYPSTYRWDNGSIAPQRTISRAGLYAVEVSNVCDTVEHVLEVEQVVCGCQVYVPTAFTPNNDGKNDAWFPVLDCEPFTYEVTVWDRWGRPVFQSVDPNEVWYGQVEGTPGSKTRESGRYYAIDGVYMWEVIIELRRDRVPEVLRQNGYVRILR